MNNGSATTEIIELLRQERRQQKISQRILANKLGLPQSHLSTIETGKTDPRLSTALDLARLLGYELTLVPIKMTSAINA